MPLLRKIIKVGTSRAITLPSEWFEYIKRKTGQEPEEVAIEVDENLVIIPLPKGGDKANV